VMCADLIISQRPYFPFKKYLLKLETLENK
jgi:hypothetical protein